MLAQIFSLRAIHFARNTSSYENLLKMTSHSKHWLRLLRVPKRYKRLNSSCGRALVSNFFILKLLYRVGFILDFATLHIRIRSVLVPGESINKNAPRLKKSCFLNIKALILKTVLFYPRYFKLGSVIYPALIGHSYP